MVGRILIVGALFTLAGFLFRGAHVAGKEKDTAVCVGCTIFGVLVVGIALCLIDV